MTTPSHKPIKRSQAWTRRLNAAHQHIRAYAIPLLMGILVGLTFYATNPELYTKIVASPCFGLDMFSSFIPCPSLVRLVNDGLMTLFFALAMTHIVRTLQAFESVRSIAWHTFNPLLAMLAGVVVPTLFFLFFTMLWGTPAMMKGFGIVTATDITVAWLILRIALGNHHPAISFLLLLALGDDIFGMLIIAFFYSHAHTLNVPALLLIVLALLWSVWGRRLFPQHPFIVFGSAGLLSWLGLYWAELHPALALVPLVPFLGRTTHAPADTPLSNSALEDAEQQQPADCHRPPLHRFEEAISPWVDYGLFFFGFANAGVPLSTPGTLTWIIFFSLFLGKTLGIYTTMRLTEKLHFLRAVGFNRYAQLLTAMSASVGLTVSLFMADAAFPPGTLQNDAKLGSLLTLLIGFPVILLARLFKPTKT
ncbi:MAG: Na+/H+ antiporter NhaA [Candidatus Carbobacillus sp.]|nr:Na+/H+ antiporter NhaA [Candidatus Carbobacillus sp.]